MAWYRAAVSAALFLFGSTLVVAAQDVMLSSPDGAVEITGDLLGFDGQFYRVDTQFGELTVDGSGVNCDGPGCPNLAGFVAELTLSGSSTMAEVLLPSLIEGFALRNDYQTRRNSLQDGNFEYLLLRGASTPVARFTFLISNTDEGFADLLANEADVVLSLIHI